MNLIGLLWFLMTGKSSASDYMTFDKQLLLKSGAFLIYLLLAYLSLRNIRFFTWLMVVILLFSGMGTAALGFLRVGWDQYFLKPYFSILGTYYIFGAAALIFYAAKRKERF